MEQKTSSRAQRWKQILAIAWPLIVANSFWNLQLTIDRIYLGAWSTEALGAAMAVMGVFWTPMALLQANSRLCYDVRRAILRRAREHEKIGSAVWQAIYCSIGGGLLFLGFLFVSSDIFTMIGHSPAMRDLEQQYFDAICWSALPTALVAVFSGFFTGLVSPDRHVDQCRRPCRQCHLRLSVHFRSPRIPCHGHCRSRLRDGSRELGQRPFGAYLLFKNKHEVSYRVRSAWRWNKDPVRRYIRYGLPSGLQWALEGLAFTVSDLVGRFENGDAALASSSITVTIMMLAVLPAVGSRAGRNGLGRSAPWQQTSRPRGRSLMERRPGLRNVHHDRRGDIFTDTGILS